jgi:GH25 family lysozyme M1 (1,4-beta-N-acetylmuramidase)
MNKDQMPRGIDVANYQGYPDWNAVKNGGYSFAFLKASEGVHYVNETFEGNWSRIKSAGLYRGAYHFGRPDQATPEQEADYFVDTVILRGGLEEGDILALDLEDEEAVDSFLHSPIPIGEYALRFLQHVERRVGFPPILYTGKWIIDGYGLANYPALANYGLWLADYRAQLPPTPAPWEFIAFWQDGVVERGVCVGCGCEMGWTTTTSTATSPNIDKYGIAPHCPGPVTTSRSQGLESSPHSSLGPSLLRRCLGSPPE